MGFESFPPLEKQEGFVVKEKITEESGILRNLAKVPGAKKIMAIMSFLSVMAAAELSMPEKSEAGLAQIFEDFMEENVKGPVEQKRNEYEEYGRLKRRDQQIYERAQYEKGEAQALKEIAKYGRPRMRSWGSRKTDQNMDFFYKGYMNAVRRWERDQRNKIQRSSRDKGRQEGASRYHRENR